MYDTIIVGAGPAGLTSAIYLCRANKKVLVLEALSYGGQIINAAKVDNYPGLPHISGYELATNLYNQALELGMEIKFEKVIDIETGDIKKVITSNSSYTCKSIILAMGAEKRKLGLPLEEELVGKGISYCATCDGMFFKNKEVALVAGNENAISDALFLADIVSKLYIISNKNVFQNNERQLKELQVRDNVILLDNSKVTRLTGQDQLESIEVVTDNEKQELEVAGLFIDVGKVPETNNITKKFRLDEHGYIMAGEDTNTNIEGIFVAGDIRAKDLRQLTTAVSDGSNAAIKAINYINHK